MVYTRVKIVKGIVLTREQIENLIEIEEDDDVCDKFYVELVDGFETKLRGHEGLRLFPFVCCSKIAGEIFIFGYEVNSFPRLRIQCSKCEEFSLCDKCIGETTNGFYDVEKILNEVVQVPNEIMCGHCNTDNVVGGRCRLCFSTETKVYDHSKKITTFAKKHLNMENPLPSCFYMLDDCLSCT